MTDLAEEFKLARATEQPAPARSTYVHFLRFDRDLSDEEVSVLSGFVDSIAPGGHVMSIRRDVLEHVRETVAGYRARRFIAVPIDLEDIEAILAALPPPPDPPKT